MAKPLMGREISKAADRKTSLAKFSVRPQRIAFVIDTGLPAQDLLKIVEVNTWIWGGLYNILVPFRSGSIPHDFLRMLQDYDPDRIVYCGSIPDSFRADLDRHVQPFNSLDLSQFFPTDRDARDFVSPVYMPQLFSREANRITVESESKVRIPTVDDQHRLRFHLMSQTGSVDERLQGFLTNQLGAENMHFGESQSLADYLSSLSQCLELACPAYLTARHLVPTFRPAGLGDAVVAFGDVGDVESLCMFWSWRMDAMDGFFGPRRQAFAYLPPDSIRTKTSLQHLADWLIRHRSHGNSVTLVGPATLRRRLQGIRRRLLPSLTPHFKRIDVQTIASFIPITRCSESETTQEIGWVGTRTRCEVPVPSFDKELLKDDEMWVVDCDFEDPSAEITNYFPPRYPRQLDLLISTSYGKWPPQSILGPPWRLSRNTVSCQANLKRNAFSIALPPPASIVSEVLHERGFKSTVSDKCRYIHSSTGILKGCGQLNTLRNSGFRDLLNGMAGGKALTYGQMMGLAKLGQDHESLQSFLMDLLSSGGVFRGVCYRCPHCGFQDWYAIQDVCELITCTGCSQGFQVPLDVVYSYRLSSLLQTTIQQGGISVMLTESVLKNLCRKSLYAVPGVIAIDQSGTEVDIDILASCDGRIVCVECKTLENSTNPTAVKEIVAQANRDYTIAERLGAQVFALAIMTNTPPRGICSFVKSKNRRKTGPLAVLIKLQDMERGYLRESCVKVPPPAPDMDPHLNIESLIHWGKVNGFQI